MNALKAKKFVKPSREKCHTLGTTEEIQEHQALMEVHGLQSPQDAQDLENIPVLPEPLGLNIPVLPELQGLNIPVHPEPQGPNIPVHPKPLYGVV